jgi:hypothetical protein
MLALAGKIGAGSCDLLARNIGWHGLTHNGGGQMENAKPILQMHEKRKFNWLVLALLIVVIGVGAYWLMG